MRRDALSGEAWLRARITEGATVKILAADTGRGERAVRYALQRYGIPRPGRGRPGVDVDELLAAYRAGEPLLSLARRAQRSTRWVHAVARQAGVRRPGRLERLHPELYDPAWLDAQVAAGATVAGHRPRPGHHAAVCPPGP